MSHTYLTDESAKYVSDALNSDNCKLTRLNITSNELTDEGGEYLSQDALKSDNSVNIYLWRIINSRADGAKRRARVLIPPGYLHPRKRKH